MGVFPQLGIIDKAVTTTINERAGNNVAVSNLMAWFRVSSAGHEASKSGVLADQGDIKGTESNGLILESIPKSNSFAASYGGFIDKERKSGRVGTDFQGNSVYADGTDRAYRPSPTIESLTIENGNRGLSKKAKFSITCYTLLQAEKVSEYFLEPGFIVLVEFGFNTSNSIAQKAKLDKDGPCQIAQFNNYEYVLNKRISSAGTYDGFMGYITGGGFTNGDDETYIIDVELTTLGEIPAYLQVHKNGSTTEIDGKINANASSLKFSTAEVDKNAFIGSNAHNVGRALFMQMFNRLPSVKQTPAVKALINKKSKLGTPFATAENFINMDDVVREKLGNLAGAKFKTGPDGEKVTIPDGTEFVTTQSFIRLELAFEILNQYAVKLERTNAGVTGCSEVQAYSFRINAEDTILRAHEHIFSTDLSKVYIPNSKLPDFGLVDALMATEAKNIFMDLNNLKTVNGCMWEDPKDLEKYAFPATNDYTGQILDGTHLITANAFQYGYLRNLYINFEFFIDVLSRTNLVAKDVYYELLNGISAAVNSYWEFDLFNVPYNPDPFDTGETPTALNNITSGYGLSQPETLSVTKDGKPASSTHPYELAVRDSTFSGNVPTATIKDKISSWRMQGILSPFLTSKMDMDIPAIMRNQILGKRSSAKVQTQLEGNPQKYMFAQGQDRVLALLNSFKEVDKTEAPEAEVPSTKEEIRKQNLELFLSRALVLPKINDRGKDIGSTFWSSGDTIDKYFIIGGWNDSNILNDIRLKDENKESNESDVVTNPAILSIGFDFDVIGVSGIKIGDLFKISDLPKQYTEFGVFQVMNVSHSLTGTTWTTSVQGKMRNLRL